MAIHVVKIKSVADNLLLPNRVQPSDIDPTSLPPTPVQDDIWYEFVGVSPNRTLSIKVYDGANWHTLASATY
jgi:hypothetical protein